MDKNRMLIVVIVAIILIIGVIIMITSGGEKLITIEEFEQKAKEQGYTIGEIDNVVTQSKPITSTKLAMSRDNKYFIEMYVLENEEATKQFYNEKKESFEAQKQEGDNAKETNKKNNDTYALKSNGYCMYVKRVNNTLISYNIRESDEQKVSEFINSL